MLFKHIFLVFSLLVYPLLAGYINPDKSNPIVPTRTNEGAIADYAFYMSLQTSISQSPTIIITFPFNQYNPVLSSGFTCSVKIIQSSITAINTCTNSQNVITIVVDQTQIPLIQSGSITITLYNVKNPSNWAGKGTGNFQVQTQSKGGITVDQNINFGSIGIAAAYVADLSSDATMSNDGSVFGGFLTNYVLVFNNYYFLRLNSWFRLTFPSEFTNFGNVQCTLASTTPSISLPCSISGQVLSITGLTTALFPGTQRIKLKNIYNPYINGQTSNFIFESLQPGVNTVIEYYSVSGVSIQPGLIKNPLVSASPLNMNLYVDYTISFTPTDPIPAGGFIIVQFPPQFGQLAATCRVILGLSDGASPITCPVTGYQVKIMNFAAASSQLMEIKVYATNPSVPGVATSQFIITTYKSATEIIDNNSNCGSIIVTDIDQPYYLYIDLYTAIINSTFSQTAPLDFRLYPNAANTLPATTTYNSVARYGEIWLQIPLWWKNYGNTYWIGNPSAYSTGYSPICYFGGVNSPSYSAGWGSCSHSLQQYKMKTPATGDASRYSTTLGTCPVGLGQCDVPISITNVVVTPIPGRWDFRVLTFMDSTTVPLEQDLFTMDIPYGSFQSVSLYTTSKDQNDINNVIRTVFKASMNIPWEGAINFNLTVQDEIYINSAGWPVTLGFSIAEQSNMIIPCRVMINGIIEGYTGSPNHPNVQCFLFTGQSSPTPINTVIQVRGFSNQINSGTQIQVDIPDVKFCTTLNMNCYIELTTSYTTVLINPYTLNYYRASMGVVTGPSIETTTDPSTFSVSFAQTEICLTTSYTFSLSFTNPTASAKLNSNDHILIKFPNVQVVAGKAPFTFIRNGNSVTSGGSTIGNYVVIWNFLTNKIYYLIKLSTTFTTGSSSTFTLPGIRNPNYHSPEDPNPDFPTPPLKGLILEQMYWASQRFCEDFFYPRTSAWTDGGITSGGIMSLPSILNGDPYDRDIDYNSWITNRISFTICHAIPSAGAVKVTVPFDDDPLNPDYVSYAGMDTTCVIWSGLVGTPVRLENEMTCTRTNNYYVIKGFLNVAQFTVIQIVFTIKTLTSAITTQPVFLVQTFFDSSLALSAGAPNENDFMSSGNQIQAPTYNGPDIFPPVMQWGEYIQQRLRARAGDRGPLFLELITNFDIAAYVPPPSSSTNGYLRVAFDSKCQVGLPYNGYLECRVNGYLSRSCVADTSVAGTSWGVIMRMPPATSVTAGVAFLLMISSRNADNSATLYEGLQWGNPGLFEMTIQSLDNSKNILEYTQITFEVYPAALLNYWVWSASKMRASSNAAITDTTHECDYLSGGAEVQCGLTLIIIYFQFPLAIAASDTTNQPRIVVEFTRANLPIYTTGFDYDLKTGLNHLDLIPCYVNGIPVLAGGTITCQLYYGTWPNPTRAFITGFDAIPTGTNAEIHFPKIFNPNSTLEVVTVTVRVQQTVSGTTSPLLEADYSLVNTTYEYPAPYFPAVTLQTLASPTYSVTFVTATIATSSSINIKFVSASYDLAPGDLIIWEFPLGWQLNDPCAHTFASAATCVSYVSCNWVALNLNTAITSGTTTSGTISMTSPPFTYIVPPTGTPIKGFIYSRSKLIYILTYPPFAQTMTPCTISTKAVVTTNNVINVFSEYSISAIIPTYIPGNGAIRITLPSCFTNCDTSCRNDVIAGSALNNLGFQCDLFTYSGVNYYIIQLGGYSLAAGDQILVKASFTNPSTAQSTSFSIETFFENASPANNLNLLMCRVLNFAGPSIVTTGTGTTVVLWDDQHHTQNVLHTSDVGPIRLTVTFTNTIPYNPTSGQLSTWYVQVQFPSSFTVHGGGQIHATWNYNQAYYTTISTSGGYNTMSIYAPQLVSVTGGTSIYLNLTTLNANDGKNGFDFPSTQGSYDFTVTLIDFSSGSAVTKETGLVYLFVPYIDFTEYSSSSLIVNAGYYTLFTIKFMPKTSVAAGGYLVFYVPTAVEFSGEPLFANDLGTGIANGGSIACNYDSGSNFAGTVACALTYGNQNIGTPASIKVSGFTNSLSAGTLYIFRVQMIKIPAETTPTDTKHVWTRLESYSSASTLINSGVFYDFTMITANPPTDLPASPSLTTAPTATSYQAGATGVTFTLSIKSPVALTYTDTNDYFVIEFPQPIFPTISSTTACTLKSAGPLLCTLASGYNWVIYKPQVSGDNLAANTATSLGVKNANQALYSNSNGIQLKAYVIARRVLTQIYYFASLGTAISTNSIPITVTIATPDILSTMLPKTTPIKFLITITLPSGTGSNNVPAGGVIDIQFPTGYSLDTFCQNDVSSQMTAANPGNIVCTNTPDSTKYSGSPYFAISGYQTIPIGYNVVILGYATTPSTSVTAGNIYIYADTLRTQQLYTYTATFPAIQTYTGFQLLKVPDEGRTPYVIRQNGQSFFQFQMIPGAAFTSLSVSFPTAATVSLPTGARPICYIGDYEAASCSVTIVGGSSLFLTLTPPISPTLTATSSYLVTIDSICGTNKGLIFGAAGKFVVTVTLGSNQGLFSFRVLSSTDFSDALMIMPYANKAKTVDLIVELVPTTSIPTNGKIVVTFPSKNYLRTLTLFDQALGYTTATYDGALINCYSVTTTSLVPINGEINCNIYITGPNPYVEVSGFTSVTNKVQFIIKSILIPNIATDNGFADIKLHSEDASGNILDERVIFDVITPSGLIATDPIVGTLGSLNCATSCTISLNGMSILSTQALNPTSGSKIMVVLPTIYNLDSSVTVTTTPASICTLQVYKNVLICTPTTAGIAASTTFSLSFSGITIIPGVYTTSTVNVYIIYDRVYKSLYSLLITFPTNADFNTGIDFSVTSSNSFQSALSDYEFVFSPGVSLAAKSVISFVFGSGFTFNRVQIIQGLTGPYTYTVSSSKIYITMTNGYAVSNGPITILITMTNPSAASSTVQLFLQSDTAGSVVIKKSASVDLTLVTQPTTTYSSACFVSIQGTQLQLNLVPNSLTVTALASSTFNIRIYGLPGITGSSGTIYDGTNTDTATVTSTASTTENYLGLGSTTINLQSSTTYTITVSGLNVDSTSIAYSFLAFVVVEGSPATFYEMCGNTLYGTVENPSSSSQFTTSSIAFGHQTAGLLNYFAVSVKSAIALTYSSTTGMYLAFYPGFAADLGFSLNDGDYVPCYISGHTNLQCMLSRSDVNYKGITKIYLQNFNPISIATSFTVYFFRVMNPINPGIYSIIFAFYDNTNSLYNYDQITAFVEQTLTITAISGTATISTSALSLSPATVQQASTGSTTLASSIALSPGDQILYFLDQVNFNTAATDSTTVNSQTTKVTCVWYSAGQMAICTVVNSINSGINMKITGFNNPSHIKDGNAFICYSVSSNDVGETAFFTFTFTNGAASGVVNALDAGGSTVRFLYQLNLPSNIPKGGCIELAFGSGAFSSPTIINLEIFSGSYQGKMTAQIIGSKAYLRNFQFFTGGTALNFILTMSGATSGGSCTVTATSYAIAPENFGAHVYSIDKGTFSLSAPATLSIISVWSPTRYLIGYQKVIKSSNTFVTFKIKMTADMTSTQYILLRPNSALSLVSTITSPIRCRFNVVGRGFYYLTESYESKSCYVNWPGGSSAGPDIMIQAPASATNAITASGYWEVMIFFAENNNQATFQTSSYNYQYPLNIYLLSTSAVPSSSNIVEYNTVVMSNILSLNQGCVKSVLSQAAKNNVVHFDITLSNAVTAGSNYLEILLPLTRITSTATDTLYAQNLGTATNTLANFNCNFVSGLPTTSLCQIWYGKSALETRPTKITITNFGSISAGTTISLDIPNVVNPAAGVYTSAYFQSYSLNATYGKQVMGFFSFPFVTYCVTPAAATTVTGTFPSTPTSGTLNVDTTITLTLSPSGSCTLAGYDGYLLTYDPNFYNPSAAANPSGAMGAVSVTNYFLNIGSSFVILNQGQTSSCSQSVIWSNIKNTPISGPYTSSVWTMSLIQNHVITQIFTFAASGSPTYIGGSFTITQSPTNLAVRVATTLATSIAASSVYSFQFDFTIGFSLTINSAIRITFPTGFTSILTAAAFTAGYAGTYSVTVSGQAVIIYNNNLALSSGTALTVILQAKSPSAGPVGAFQYDAFTSYPPSGTNQKATFTSNSGLLTVTTVIGINGMKIQGLTLWKEVQANDYGPIEFHFTLASALTMKTGYIDVVSSTLLWNNVIVNTATYDDMKCFWGNMAAYTCQAVSQGFRIFAPTSNGLVSGTTYVVYVATNRAVTNGGLPQENFLYQPAATYSITITPSAGTSTTVTLVISPPDFPNSFINNYMTTISQYSIFLVSLTPTVAINGNTGSTPGQILIEFPTSNSASVSLFPTDLGTGYSNGELMDCVCTGACPAGLECTLNKGGNSVLSPSYIIIDSTNGFAASQSFVIRFPKIQMPSTSKLFLQMRIVARAYAAGVWSVTNELIHIDIFYTTTYVFNTQPSTSLTTPAFNPNLVGKPGTISFGLTQNVGQVKTGFDDRYILESTTTEMVFEYPPATYRGNSYTLSVSGATVTLYAKCKWIEVAATPSNLNSQTTLTFNNLKNMPYQIANNGIIFNVYVWIDGNLKQVYNFPLTAEADVNTFITESYTPIPPVIMFQPNTYTFTFQPYNRIPTNGKIVLSLPNCGTDCTFTFFDSYCTVYGGISSASCDIIPGTTATMVVQDLSVIYDPFLPTAAPITISFFAQNPSSSAPGSTYFQLATYYSYNGNYYLMDQDLSFDSSANERYQVQGGSIILATVQDLYQVPKVLCAGRVGPLILMFQFSGNLNYPNDYISINFYLSFSFNPVSAIDELICYFDDLSNIDISYIKSYRCEYSSTATQNTIKVYIPEEMSPFLSTQTYRLTITSKISGGLTATAPSGIYWAVITTSTTNDRAWSEVKIPACPFDGTLFDPWDNNPTVPVYYLDTTFYVESFSGEISNNYVTDPTWTGLNLTLTTVASAIPTGNLAITKNSRILIEFPTNNELDSCWDVNLGVVSSGYQAEVGCGGQYLGGRTPLKPDPYTSGCTTCYIQCTAVQGAGSADNSTPAYVMFNNYETIPAYTKFNLQISRIANPSTLGVFSHIIIHVQSRMNDGSYYDIYYHPRFYLIPSYTALPGGVGELNYLKTTSGASRTGQSSNGVTKNMGNVTWLINPISANMNLGDVVVFEQNVPYVMSIITDCSQMKSSGQWYNPVNRPQMGCASHYYSRWFTIHNTLSLTAGSDQFYVVDYINWIQNTAYWVNPDYEYKNPDGTYKSLVNVYIYQNYKLTKYYTFSQTPVRDNIRLILQTSDAKNDVNAVITYYLGIILGTPKPALQYLRITAPTSFQSISNCAIRRGLVLANMADPTNDITCQITTNPTNYLIEIYNFGVYNGDGWLMLSLDMKNPATAGWTLPWTVTTYASQPVGSTPADLTMVMDSSSGGNNDAVTWVGAKPFPNLFRVYRNTVSYYNRKASLGQYAEVDIRLIPKTLLPSTTGGTSAWVEIWMPDSFDIPNGGTSVCEMGQNYHTDITGQYCQISSDRMITMYTNNAQGLGSACSLLTWTTVGAIGGDGVLLPDTPITESFQVYEYINNNLVEYSLPGVTTQPQQLTTLSFISTIRENEDQVALKYRNTVFRISFQSNSYIPAGYDTTPNIVDPLLKNPIGYITYEFNTVDNFVYGYNGYPAGFGQATTSMPCRAISGLIPPAGGTIQCIITPAATSYNYFSLALVTVSNFQAISSGDTVEIHFLECKPVYSYYNNGYIQIGAYQLNADGTQNQIIMKTKITLGYYLKITTIPDMTNLPSSYYLDASIGLVSISPATNYVGTYSIMTFNFMLTTNMPAKSFVVFRFPSEFELSYQVDSEIQAIIDGIVMITVIYATGSVNEIYFQVPTGQTIAADAVNYKIFKIAQIRNMAYQISPATYQIELLLILNTGFRQANWIYTNIPGAIAGPFSAKLMVLSSYFSADVNVLYTFSFTPTYRVPSGSTITVNFPNHIASPYIGLTYNIPTSSPAPICTVTPSQYMNPAAVYAYWIVITTQADIPQNTAIQILLSGVRNPTYVGPTVINDYNIIIKNPSGNTINQDGFSSFNFLAAKSPNVLYMNIGASSLYKSASCDYVFSMQPSTTLAQGGQIFMKFPPEWASSTLASGCTISHLSGSFSSSVLSYTISYTSPILTIIPGFSWPAKSTLYIEMDGLINPSNVDTTTVFQAYTQYDSVKLDMTDPNNLGLTLTFLDYNATVYLAQTPVVYPSNEAQVATYSFNLTSEINITAGSQLELQFSSAFSPNLTTSDKTITCYSALLGGIIPCTVSNGKVIIPITKNITNITNQSSNSNNSNETNSTTNSLVNPIFIDLQISGIVNPNSNSVGSMDIDLRQGTSVVSYVNQNCTFQSTSAPKWLNLTFMNTTSTNLQQKSNYTFCVQTYDPIPTNASVLIGFPSQFSFMETYYPCETAPGHNATTYMIVNGVQTPSCSVSDPLRIINISNQTSGYNGTSGVGILCYEVGNIANPSDSGESGNFVVSIYDEDTLQILYSTYGVLSYPSTIVYSRQGLRITVGTIQTLYVGTMSANISVTLERSVSYAIYLTPSSSGFSFVPPIIAFYSYLPKTQYFMIQPLTNATLGLNKITWSKNETSQPDQFSEVADSFFTLAQNPSANELTLTISPIILRTAQLGTSLPITVTLSVAPAQTMIVHYSTYKPNQTDFVLFNPQNLTFGVGQTQLSFTYYTKMDAVSGQILFWLDSPYDIKYTMNTNIVNFEIMDLDNSPPQILNYYIIDMDRTYMYFRISTSESGWVYYILAYKGTKQPSNAEISDPSIRVKLETKTVWEIYGSNCSYQAPVTKTYIYYDTYLHFTGLEEQTDYILYFLVEDLSGNQNPVNVGFSFTTLKKHLPAKFFLKLTDDVTISTLLSALGLVTAMEPSRFTIDSNPPKFSIPGINDTQVINLLNSQITTYALTLLQNPTLNDIRPIEHIKSLETSKSILIGALPQIVPSFNIIKSAYEIIAFQQEFSYSPILMQVDQNTAYFNLSIKRNGSVYGIVMLQNSTVPNPRQMKYALDSNNFLLDPLHFINISFVYPTGNRGQSIIYQIGNFTNLYDNTAYDAYFIADNDLPVNPDLMPSSQIQKVSFQTQIEIFVIPDTYRASFAGKLGGNMILMIIILITLIFI